MILKSRSYHCNSFLNFFYTHKSWADDKGYTKNIDKIYNHLSNEVYEFSQEKDPVAELFELSDIFMIACSLAHFYKLPYPEAFNTNSTVDATVLNKIFFTAKATDYLKAVYPLLEPYNTEKLGYPLQQEFHPSFFFDLILGYVSYRGLKPFHFLHFLNFKLSYNHFIRPKIK